MIAVFSIGLFFGIMLGCGTVVMQKIHRDCSRFERRFRLNRWAKQVAESFGDSRQKKTPVNGHQLNLIRLSLECEYFNLPQ